MDLYIKNNKKQKNAQKIWWNKKKVVPLSPNGDARIEKIYRNLNI